MPSPVCLEWQGGQSYLKKKAEKEGWLFETDRIYCGQVDRIYYNTTISSFRGEYLLLRIKIRGPWLLFELGFYSCR